MSNFNDPLHEVSITELKSVDTSAFDQTFAFTQQSVVSWLSFEEHDALLG